MYCCIKQVAPLEIHKENLEDAEDQLRFLIHAMKGVKISCSLSLLKGSFSYWIWNELGILVSCLICNLWIVRKYRRIKPFIGQLKTFWWTNFFTLKLLLSSGWEFGSHLTTSILILNGAMGELWSVTFMLKDPLSTIVVNLIKEWLTTLVWTILTTLMFNGSWSIKPLLILG